MFKEDTSNISTVIDLLLTFPPTSVNNETTFSRTKLTKGKRRGHLKIDTLSDLVQIELETPDISSFDPKASIDDWMVGFRNTLKSNLCVHLLKLSILTPCNGILFLIVYSI